ncbi:MAG TPA: hypothetical protein VGI23_20855 [Steroidobacteraceae bacterium]|jgi:hypothetical protein
MKTVFFRTRTTLCALSLTVLSSTVLAEEDSAAQPTEDDLQAIIVTANRATRSSVALTTSGTPRALRHR